MRNTFIYSIFAYSAKYPWKGDRIVSWITVVRQPQRWKAKLVELNGIEPMTS